MIPETQSIKETTGTLNFIQIKSFCYAKDTVVRKTRPDKLFANHITWQRSCFQNIKISQNSVIRKQPKEKWAKDLNRYFTREIWKGKDTHEKYSWKDVQHG